MVSHTTLLKLPASDGKYVEMNAAHPFMEGNGRSTRIWLDMIFKKRMMMCVDWSRIDKKEYLDAMIASHTNSSRIRTLLKGALTDKINDRETFKLSTWISRITRASSASDFPKQSIRLPIFVCRFYLPMHIGK